MSDKQSICDSVNRYAYQELLSYGLSSMLCKTEIMYSRGYDEIISIEIIFPIDIGKVYRMEFPIEDRTIASMSFIMQRIIGEIRKDVADIQSFFEMKKLGRLKEYFEILSHNK